MSLHKNRCTCAPIFRIDNKYLFKHRIYNNSYIIYSFYTFSYFKTPIIDAKNNKKCKINSRNFTYDGLTFSSSFLLFEDVKDEI